MDRTAGLSLVELMVVLTLIALVAAFTIPNLLEGRRAANESSAIGSLRALSTMQTQFRTVDSEQDGVQDYAMNLSELSNTGLIDNVLGAGAKSGYEFTLSGDTFDWAASATPSTSNTGNRNFMICTDGVVRFASSSAATCSSTAIR